ncbi:hypothetical protein HDU79_007253, partial [Rhizoclosmatium sp. JEL0117]
MLKTSCLPCHTGHRKCIADPNRAQPCDQCLRNGRACQYEGGPAFPPHRKTCSLCKKDERKCVAGIDDQPCNRCIRIGAKCIYLTVTLPVSLTVSLPVDLEQAIKDNPLPQVNEPLQLAQSEEIEEIETWDASITVLDSAGDVTILDTNPILDLYTHVLDSSQLYSFESYEMEDPDLMPTHEDWIL